MPDDKRFRRSDVRKRMWLIGREVLDALLVILLLISIGSLFYLQLRREGRLPLSDRTPEGTRIPAFTPTLPRTSTPVLRPSVTYTRTPTRTPSPTATSVLTATPTPSVVLTATSISNSGTQLPVDLEIEDGIKRGNQVVEAIEAYTRAKGFYPATLDDLVPDYLPAFPVTSTDQPFFFRMFERTTVMSTEIYWVSFRVVSQSNLTCTYYRRLQYWDCNFSSP